MYVLEIFFFCRLVKEIAEQVKPSNVETVRFQRKAVIGLKEAAEEYITVLLANAHFLAKHAERSTTMQKDVQAASSFS